MTMTSEARRALSDTIRHLRTQLVEYVHGAVDSQWRLLLSIDELPNAEDRVARGRFEELVRERARAHRRRHDARTAASAAEGARDDLEKLAAATWLNRIVFLRILEATTAANRRGNHVVTAYKSSEGYREFLDYAGPLRSGPSFGYDVLLRVLFEELALDLPGLFGVGVADLLPFPPAALNELLEAVNDPALESCWSDDTTLGWIYQYWNDPDREALDAKLNDGQKLAPHEIASKTQMFTERYMVEWLLHNSLGPAWLRICRKNGWTPEVVRDGVLDELEARRADWRARRDRGEVALDALMPLHTDAERRWAYYVPQELPSGDLGVPDSIRDLRLLDPACGSGHFLVIAFDLLLALYEEEDRHRGVRTSQKEIAEAILERNLHGVDLDVRAVQIAAAALWLKARLADPTATPKRINLVAADMGLQRLGPDDPARKRFVEQLRTDTAMPPALTDAVWKALADVDHLGSLLRVEETLKLAIEEADREFFRPDARSQQGKMFDTSADGGVLVEEKRFGRVRLAYDEAMERIQRRVGQFLAAHTGSDDLGLRLEGEQLAAGLRFLSLMREESYHLVVANPPYQGTSKMADAGYVGRHYPRGKADLYAAFMERALQLCAAGGTAALVTMRNWMFIAQYERLRTWLLSDNHLRALADLDSGAFEEISAAQVVVSTVMFVASPGSAGKYGSVALRAFDSQSVTRPGETGRKRAALLAEVGTHHFATTAFDRITGKPMVYWWPHSLLLEYEGAPKLGDKSPCKVGIVTGNNVRFTRHHWELASNDVSWAPYVTGAQGMRWLDPCDDRISWRSNGLETKCLAAFMYGTHSRQIRGEDLYFRKGIACTALGAHFGARLHRRESIIGSMAASVFPTDLEATLCALNSHRANFILASLNPGLHFEAGDINRLPVFTIDCATEIVHQVEAAFGRHESHRESSAEFLTPGPSPWAHAQEWAQEAVDRPTGAPLPPYAEVLVPEPPTDQISYALGVALGRFHRDGSGIVDPATADLTSALPDGILFLDGAADGTDDLDNAASAPLLDAWRVHGPAIDGTNDARGLRAWLRTRFFAVHKAMYENRPIHWPLSSENRTFVAWVNIHRMGPQTLTAVLAKAETCFRNLKARSVSLRADRDGADTKASKLAEKALGPVQKQLAEIEKFVNTLRALAYRGPPPPAPSVRPRDVDAPYKPDLDDGVMINSSALWPVLEPQWKDPRKWWTELATASGRKDYDWSHLAMRYWPDRVDKKCQDDPSLAVAHGRFWRYHPARAYAWELRLQDEIGPGFRIQEPDAEACRVRFLYDEPELAEAVRDKEARRRARQARPQFDDGAEEAPDDLVEVGEME